ncbi:hypothetical protein P3S68_023904 [Capsicum galapagoense]
MIVLLLIDGKRGSAGKESSIRQYTIPAGLLDFKAYAFVFATYIIPTLRDIPAMLPLVVPWLARCLHGGGTVIGWGSLVLTLIFRPDVGIYVYFAHLSGVVCIFCTIMLLRPVATDMGCMYALWALSISLSRRYGHLGVLTWIALAFCIFLWLSGPFWRAELLLLLLLGSRVSTRRSLETIFFETSP